MDIKMLLLSLKRLRESHDMPRYAYTIGGNPAIFKKHFADNCKKFAEQVENSIKNVSPNQSLLLKAIARNIRNQNLMLAQDVIKTLDIHTKSLIPKQILDFVERYS